MPFGKQSFSQLIEFFLHWFPTAAIVICLVSICMFFILDFPRYQRAGLSKHWPIVDATITNSGINTETQIGSPFIKNLRTTLYSAHIEYNYIITGTKYHSNRISIAGYGGSKFMNGFTIYRKLIEQFPKGSTAKAYYDPSDPAFAILTPGVDIEMIMSPSMMIGGIILALGLGLYISCQIVLILRSPPFWGITAGIIFSLCYLLFLTLIGAYFVAAVGGLLPRIFVPHEWLIP
jgi:hypothetical protein